MQPEQHVASDEQRSGTLMTSSFYNPRRVHYILDQISAADQSHTLPADSSAGKSK